MKNSRVGTMNVLVLSHDPFSLESSNGRTLGEYFLNWDPENISQIFINSFPLDMIDCDYLQISEKSILRNEKKQLYKEKRFGDLKNSLQNSFHKETRKKFKKNPLTCLIRNAAWNLHFKLNKYLTNWIIKHKPDVLLVQVGDAPFLLNIAIRIAKKFNLKMIVFNTEDYPLKTWNYLHKENGYSWLYPIYRKKIIKSYKRLITFSSACIYNSPSLCADFDNFCKCKNSFVLMPSTNFNIAPRPPEKKNILYAGNLSGKRYEILANLSDIVKSISNDISIDIYALTLPDNSKELLLSKDNINLYEPVSYEKLKVFISKAWCLINVENTTEYYVLDRKHEFSTKIVDFLAAFKPFIVFGDRTMAFAKHIIDFDCAEFVSTPKELDAAVKKLFYDYSSYEKKIRNSEYVLKKYHSMEKNRLKMIEILQNVIYEK